MSFAPLGLRDELLSAIAAQGYTTPTPIQIQAIPAIFSGCDLLAGAQTGTGKTAAFALPIVQRLGENPNPRQRRRPRALVLVPTRELAAQVSDQLQYYGRRLSLRSTMIYGGVNIQAQIERLQRGVDLVVATPGRLLDHAHRGSIKLTEIEVLVLDEADRMLDLGFIDDILKVVEYLPSQRQNLLFSATYSTSIKQLADELLDKPRRIEVARRNLAADMVSQTIYPVEQGRKREMLSHLIRKGEWNQVLVFTRTRYGADKLTAELLFDGISAAAIHSNKSQSLRTRTLKDFKQGELRVLVATDVAARGLDIANLPHVVNYELPQVAEDYVHRIGRTGRAGVDGIALSLVCPAEKPRLQAIEKLLKYVIPQQTLAEFPPIAIKRRSLLKSPQASRGPSRSKPAPVKAKQVPLTTTKLKSASAKAGKPSPPPTAKKTRMVRRDKLATARPAAKTGRRGNRS